MSDEHTPVHPEGTVERSIEILTRATDEEIEAVLDEMSEQHEDTRPELEETTQNNAIPHVQIGDKISTPYGMMQITDIETHDFDEPHAHIDTVLVEESESNEEDNNE